MAFLSTWPTSVFDAAAVHTYVIKRRALHQGRLGSLPSVTCCVKSAPGHSVSLRQLKNLLTSLPRRLPKATPPPLKREQCQVLHRCQESEEQKRLSKSTTSERQLEEPQSYCPPLQCQVLRFSPIRYAPKRKGSGASAAGAKTPGTGATAGVAAGAGHIFNIYKDILEDHTLLPYDAYPKWLLTLGQPEKSYGELAFTFLYGVGIENATLQEYMRFTRLHTKNVIKLNNMRLKKAKRSSVKPIYYDV